MARFASVCSLLLLVFLPIQVMGQGAPPSPPSDQEQAAEAMGNATLPQLTDPFFAALSGAEIEAGEADKQARVRIATSTGFGSFAATLSTPLENGANRTKLASLDGLADSLALKVTYSRFVGVKINMHLGRDLLSYCESHGIPTARTHTVSKCDENSIAKEFPGKLPGFLLHESFENPVLQIFSLEAAAGRRDTEYLSPDSGDKVEENKTPWSLGMGWGVLGKTWFLGANARYERKFKDGSEVQICNPVNDVTSLEKCTKGPLGPPTESEGVVGSISSRVFFKKVALAPAINYDFDTDVLGVEMPVYFLRSGDQFTGGLTLGWRDDTDDLTASIFISKPLSLN